MNALNSSKEHIDAKKPNKKLIAILVLLLVLSSVCGVSYFSGKQIVSIKAAYNGPTQAGTVLDSTNTSILVTGRTKNRSTVEIPFGNWTVEETQILSPDVTASVSIQYEGKTCELRVACTDSQVASIAASYTGPREAGTVINNSSDGFSVRATLRNGTEVDITDTCVIDDDSVTLKENKTSTVSISYTDPFSNKVFSTVLDVVCSTKTVKQIAAKYVGEAPEGEILDSSNPNFIVSATYDNGSVEQVQDWEILEPAVLAPSKSAVVTITYGGQKANVVVECRDFDLNQYRKNCSRGNYNNLVRYPEQHIGSMIYIRGSITDVYESASASRSAYCIRVNSRQYVNITFQGTLSNGNLIEGDYVTCYGTFMGIESDDNGYPLLSARIIDR